MLNTRNFEYKDSISRIIVDEFVEDEVNEIYRGPRRKHNLIVSLTAAYRCDCFDSYSLPADLSFIQSLDDSFVEEEGWNQWL